MSDEALTPAQVARELRVTPRTVQRWIRDGRLPAQRVGGRFRVSRSSLAALAGTPAGDVKGPAAGRRITRVFIANRGEIAERIARTTRRLGIASVAAREAGDRRATGADAIAEVASYLDGPALVDAARRSGADAIHPGYGFLAEDPAFAADVEAAGLAWVGPPPAAIAAMGDKAAARRHATRDGVPVLPGYDGEAQDAATLRREARRIGLPLMVKPSAGGGGKGMRLVRGADELDEALATSRREAQRAFGDERLILERFVEGARHVEIQVLCDAHGASVHLGERDCSAQRRNQKILEESPGPAVDAALRERMGAAALAVATSVGYVGAGTIEFLLADDETFSFLEMNTRLQVEHPVTELVTGRDLVADQLRIAAGDTLADIGLGSQRAVELAGHAIEVRLYAEDPEHGFLPATGTLHRLRWPSGEGIRVDAGVAEGDAVTDRYDPMLAKLIAHGTNRGQALERLRRALAATSIMGVRTNLRFLRWLVDHPLATSGEIRTDTLAHLELPAQPDVPAEAWAAAARLLLQPTDAPDAAAPWAGGWRVNATPVIRLRTGDEERRVEVAEPGGAGGPAAVRAGEAAHVDVEGQSIEIGLAPAPTTEDAARHAAAHDGEASVLVAPMPGRVIAVRAAVGDAVEAHAVVVVLEAMKMEHAVTTPVPGRVSVVAVAEGQQVQRGDMLASVEPA